MVNAQDICHFLRWVNRNIELIFEIYRDNQVDYIKDTDFFQIYTVFDKDQDGNLDFDDFLQFVLPYDDIKLRAKVS